MAILSRLLIVLMFVRLMLPPGICICKWSSPAAHLLAHLLNAEAPAQAPAHDDDGDHAPGCPASILSTGMGVKPPAGPFVLPPDLVAALTPTLPALAPEALVLAPEPSSSAPPPTEGLYLSLCALLL